MDASDPFSLNVRGVTDLVLNRTNKVNSGSGGDHEGPVGDNLDALTLDMDDEKLLALRTQWENAYAPYRKRIEAIRKRNLESYLGKKADGQWLAGEDNIATNLQFEAEETFLAAALARNPAPVVYVDNTPEGNALAKDVRTMLQFHSDLLVLRARLKLMVRQWSINHLAVIKHGWDNSTQDITLQNRRVQDFIFDPKGYVNPEGDFVGYLGEPISLPAEKVIAMFPKHADFISQTVEGKLGTEITYTEWWSADDTYTFTTYRDRVLDKSKNPYFIYEEEEIEPVTGEPMVDELGRPILKRKNHFAVPKKPYTFLSVFSLGEQPHDLTGLIEQNIATQNRITRRTDQIDANISRQNNSDIFSENNFNQETAKQAANAKRKGNPILVPAGGPIGDAIHTLEARGLPNTVFVELENNKNDLRTSWGIQGISAQPQDEDQTARGMILNQSHDTSRIGGGIGDALDQVADNIFNWFVQMYYVFYDEPHFAAVMGNAKAVDFVTFSNAKFNKQMVVSVAAGSMKPHDEITEMNLAQALFDKGAIGPKTLLTMVDFPNPDEAAADGSLWATDKLAYIKLNFPEMFAQLQGAQAEMMAAGGMPNPSAGGGAPEGITEPPPDLSAEPASADLGQVPLPPLPQ